MKKILFIALVLGLCAFGAASANAGDVEMSGHVTTGGGWQHYSNGNGTANPYALRNADGGFITSGVMGKYINNVGVNAVGPKSDHFNFFVDEAELDIAKSFGENVRLRADLAFGRALSSGNAALGANLEQAYATVNIPVGNGAEFLLGRFDTPIGFESTEISENDTISSSALVGLRPTTTTGMKFYYAVNDLVDIHFYAVNKLFGDTDVKMNDLPSFGARLGFNWGEEGAESTFGISPFFGPESGISNKHFSFGGDLDANVWLGEKFAIGFEGLFARHNSVSFSGDKDFNAEYLAGLLNLHYVANDVWDGTLKYAYAMQTNGIVNGSVLGAADATDQLNLMGYEGTTHQVALAGGYAIADGAKLKLEGRMDMGKMKDGEKYYTYGLAMAFAYDF